MIAFLRIVPWLTVGAVASGVGALFLLRYLYRYRDRPGVDWLILCTGAVTASVSPPVSVC
jgi:hypothetical protein